MQQPYFALRRGINNNTRKQLLISITSNLPVDEGRWQQTWTTITSVENSSVSTLVLEKAQRMQVQSNATHAIFSYEPGASILRAAYHDCSSSSMLPFSFDPSSRLQIDYSLLAHVQVQLLCHMFSCSSGPIEKRTNTQWRSKQHQLQNSPHTTIFKSGCSDSELESSIAIMRANNFTKTKEQSSSRVGPTGKRQAGS